MNVCMHCEIQGDAKSFDTKNVCKKCAHKIRHKEITGKCTCKNCGFSGDGALFNSRNVCKKCYNKKCVENRSNLSGILICKKCGFSGDGALFNSRNVCKKCSKKLSRNYQSNLFGILTCKLCGFSGDAVEFTSRNRCKECSKKASLKYNECQRLGTNKKASTYLGIYIAERVLSKIYKNVKVMPYRNPKFDFVCGKGFKIDVKSSILVKNGDNKNKQWKFGIKKNQIADYFLCIAFDNRNDLNPQHIWLFPGKDVNSNTGISSTINRINKWKQYEQSIDKVLECCDALRT